MIGALSIDADQQHIVEGKRACAQQDQTENEWSDFHRDSNP